MNTSIMVRSDLSVSILPVASQYREEALEVAALIGVVKNVSTQESAVEALAKIKGILKLVEESRQEIKAPVLELCREIDDQAKKFTIALKAEELRISTMVGNYQQEQLAIARRAEQARQAELDRIEAERLAAERKAKQEAQAAADALIAAERKAADEARAAEAVLQAELRRLADEESRAKNAAERKRLQAERDALEAKRKAEAEAAQVESDRRVAETARVAVAAAAESTRQNELALQAAEAVGPAFTTAKADGQTVKDTFDFEVVDIQLLQRMHPGFVKMEARRDEIMLAIGKGIREIKGLRVFPVVKINVKAEKLRPVIEV